MENMDWTTSQETVEKVANRSDSVKDLVNISMADFMDWEQSENLHDKSTEDVHMEDAEDTNKTGVDKQKCKKKKRNKKSKQ